MNNQIETIDGVKGEWRTVTKPEEVKAGQRVRYSLTTSFSNHRFGYTGESNRWVSAISVNDVSTTDTIDERFGVFNLFSGDFSNIQAFFTLLVNPTRKVAKVRILGDLDSLNRDAFYFSVAMLKKKFVIDGYSSRKSAIRGARLFCRAIGYECEIIK